MAVVLIALGTNLGDRLANLRAALRRLDGALHKIKASPVYETEARYVEDQPAFLNMAVRAETTLAPAELLTALKQMERELGRETSERYGPRLIDIDILFYDSLVLHQSGLTIPHPRIAERAFVLRPLADIAPRWLHPETGTSVADMLADLADEPGIRLAMLRLDWRNPAVAESPSSQA